MSLPYPLRLLPGLCVLLALGSGCTSSTPNGPNCPGPRAAFHVTITAKYGPLPADTVVRVVYGGGEEEYALASPPAQPAVVFCHPIAADGGVATSDAGDAGDVDAAIDASSAEAGSGATDAGTSPVAALSCDLWTNAAATINIQGSGYPVLEEQLQAEKDDCGIKTVEYALVLGEGDGGI